MKEGSLSRSQNTLTPSPSLLNTQRDSTDDDKETLPASDTFDSTMWQSFSSCCHQINNITHCFLQKRSVCFPLRIRHKTLNINAFSAPGHIQNSNNIWAVSYKWQLCGTELFSHTAFIPGIKVGSNSNGAKKKKNKLWLCSCRVLASYCRSGAFAYFTEIVCTNKNV